MSSNKRVLSAKEQLAGFAAQLEPGDILMATPQQSRATEPVRRALDRAFAFTSQQVQNSDMTHSMIYAGGGKVVETRIGEGVSHRPLDKALSGLEAVALRPVGLPLSERKRAARAALRMVKEKPAYAFKALLKALLHEADAEDIPVGKVNGIICSDLITRSYDHPIVDKPHDAVLPVDFLRSTRLAQVAEHKASR